MFVSLASRLICDQESFTIESDAPGLYKSSFQNFPEFGCGQRINHYVRILAIQDTSSFHPIAQVG